MMSTLIVRRSLLALGIAALAVALPAAQGKVSRILQTNAAGDNTHVIDPVTNKVVAIIEDIEVPHGVSASPDGTKVFITNESMHTLDVINPKTWKVEKRIPLSGRPNNLMVGKDSRKVYVGIAQAPGAVDVIEVATLTRVKSVPVEGSVHNVYVTPDGKFAVSGSVGARVISVIDTRTDTVAWQVKLDAGIRPMTFDTNADGSTRHIFVQLSGFHGVAVVDFATRREITRFTLPPVAGEEEEFEGLQGAPAHGLSVTPDNKTLLATSKSYGALYAYSLPDFKFLGSVVVGSHPEWITLTPDGKTAYVAVAGDDETAAVDIKTLKVVGRVKVGYVPKRNGTLVLASDTR